MTTQPIHPSSEWLAQFQANKHLLRSPVNFNELFNADEIDDCTLTTLTLGKLRFPTGKFIVADPIIGLSETNKPYYQSLPIGEFVCQLLVATISEDHYRHVALKINLSPQETIYWEQALHGVEELDDLDAGDYFGFGVDTGFAAICDAAAQAAFANFEQQWYEKHPDEEIYSDYFLDLFEENAKKYPKCQDEDGGWLLFTIPNTDFQVLIVSSGWGDGYYPVYLGYDAQGNVTEVIIDFLLFDNDE